MPPPVQHSETLVDSNTDLSFLAHKEAALIPALVGTRLGEVASNPQPIEISVDASQQSKKEPLSVGTQRGAPHSVCHGRVSDPEAMVPPAWWKSVFADEMYLKTDGDVVEDADITLSEIRLLEADPVIQPVLAKGRHQVNHHGEEREKERNHKNRVLDLCCGQGRHTLKLVELYPGLELHGHDQSEYLIQLARSRAALAPQEAKDRMAFTIGDCRSIPHPDESFALVLIMGNSFGYFASDNADSMVLREVERVLQPGGVVVLDVTDGAYMRENFSARSWEWIDDTMITCRERQLSKDKKRLISREVVILADKGVIRDQFYQERLYDYHELAELMREAGLKMASLEEDKLVTGQESKRGEDLGMMGQRDFVVAYKPLQEGA
ncbi:hypothetical protein DFQ27_000403 [Actinomortierella ambigua]|uniref:Methyltransferase domain-containing protein n=1 Tax=Actinomortierella ambigua TaxID=1343610 RepID=A0A9P6UD53_9FUNG|nr:hypothetical protein DFQ27_000403 [Actinomortierella ambigua]